MSECEIACELGIHRQTMRYWADKNHRNGIPEFIAVYARAKEASQAWWESRARVGAIGTEPGMINAQVWKHIASCRFRQDYADRPDGFVARAGDAAPQVQINYIAAAPQIESPLPAAAERVLEAVIIDEAGNGSGEES